MQRAFSSTALPSFLAGLLALLVAFGDLRAQNPGELTAHDKTEIFIQHLVKVLQLEPSRYRSLVLEYEIGTALAELAGNAADRDLLASDFVDNALGDIYPEYRRAVDLAAAGDDRQADEVLRSLLATTDPYLRAYAKLRLADIAFRAARYDAVVKSCEHVLKNDRRFLVADHHACELLAKAFKELKRPMLEFAQYALLLTDFQDVPPDVEARVRQRLKTLSAEVGRPLDTVAGWMDDVEKLLVSEVTAADPTQAREGEIVAALDKLIELQEAIERQACSSCGGGNCKGSCRNGAPKGNRSNSPAEVSRLPPRGKGDVLLHGVSRADAGSVWGQLKSKDASRAIQSFRGKLPARYEKLLEEYYKALSKESS